MNNTPLAICSQDQPQTLIVKYTFDWDLYFSSRREIAKSFGLLSLESIFDEPKFKILK